MEEEKKKKKPLRISELKAMLADSEQRVLNWTKEYMELEDENKALKKANAVLEEELKNVRNELNLMEDANDRLCKEVSKLRAKKGFFARLFNK